MNIVIEGCDAAGKSTLINALVTRIGWKVIPSEGPPKGPGEMNQRVMRYRKYHYVLFDRHPCVSQPIYAMIRGARDDIDPSLVEEFYKSKPFFVYCRPDAEGFKRHTFNPAADNPEHVKEVEQNYQRLLGNYEAWAYNHAHFIYRLGQRFEETVDFLSAIADRAISKGW